MPPCFNFKTLSQSDFALSPDLAHGSIRGVNALFKLMSHRFGPYGTLEEGYQFLVSTTSPQNVAEV